MAIQLVKASETFAKSLINQDKINDTASWSFSADDGNALLAANNDNWANYAKWHLGKNTEATKETKAYYKYPFGKNGKLYMSALRAIRTRAAQQDHTSIYDAAGRLLDAAKKKVESRGDIMDLEIRSYYVPTDLQVRAVEDTEGIFEGYAIVWDSVDSHGTRFRKGCCTKTLKERGDRVKILDNHEINIPIGKPLELREDDVGLFVRGELLSGVQAADEMRIKIEKEVIDTLSVGFKTIQDRPAGGSIRDITEIKLYELSPVTFASNEAAAILGIRSEDFTKPDNEPFEIDADTDTDTNVDTRGADAGGDVHGDGTNPPEGNIDAGTEHRETDFDETLEGEELYERGILLNDALRYTLSDIWWSSLDTDEMVAAFDTAIAKYHVKYLEWAKEFMAKFWEERHELMASKDMGSVFKYELHKTDQTIEKMAMETTFTTDELQSLSDGKLLLIESRAKLTELPDVIQKAHRAKRVSVVESYCNELRASGFTGAEAVRFSSLLGLSDGHGDASSDEPDIFNTLDKIEDGVNS